MNFYMEASIENLKALKDLDYELSDIAEDHLKELASCWGKTIAIAFGTVSIHSGAILPKDSISLVQASHALTLYNLGMSQEQIFKTINEAS